MTRRCLCLAALTPWLRADEAQEIWESITSMVSALGEDHAGRFLAAFDPTMPGLESLRSNVTALLRGWEVQASVELLRSQREGNRHLLELDWIMLITERAGIARTTRRRETVKCRLALNGKKWRILEFEPLSLFAPPRIAAG